MLESLHRECKIFPNILSPETNQATDKEGKVCLQLKMERRNCSDIMNQVFGTSPHALIPSGNSISLLGQSAALTAGNIILGLSTSMQITPYMS